MDTTDDIRLCQHQDVVVTPSDPCRERGNDRRRKARSSNLMLLDHRTLRPSRKTMRSSSRPFRRSTALTFSLINSLDTERNCSNARPGPFLRRVAVQCPRTVIMTQLLMPRPLPGGPDSGAWQIANVNSARFNV